jgi:hypothetical protein
MKNSITEALEKTNSKIIDALNQNNDILGKLTMFLERKFN